MIRLTLLAIFITFFCFYAFRDWYKSLCVLIMLIGVLEHPDMPKGIGGIQGANPWNILFLFVLMGCWSSRIREGLKWDMPRHITALLIIFAVIIVEGFLHMIMDRSTIYDWYAYVQKPMPGLGSLVSENIINCFKWLVPGLLLFYGCNSRKRFFYGTAAILIIYLVLGVQVIKWMPLGTITGGQELSERSLKILVNEIGYHRVNLGMLLAGGAWGVFCTRVIVDKKYVKWIIVLSFMLLFALALTGGRTGLGTWAAVGLILATFKWRKYLLLAPTLILVILTIVPSAYERMTSGFDEDSHDGNPMLENSEYYQEPEGKISMYTITSGRNIAWPYVINKILESPWLGYGRLAMVNTGITSYLWIELGESFPHPHNLYLEFLLDNGVIGFIPIIWLFILIVKYSLSLFTEKHSPICIAAGGVAFSLVGAFLIAGIGSQTFYPREGSVGMWCAIGLMLRVFVERMKIYSREESLRKKIRRQNTPYKHSHKKIEDKDLWCKSASSR